MLLCAALKASAFPRVFGDQAQTGGSSSPFLIGDETFRAFAIEIVVCTSRRTFGDSLDHVLLGHHSDLESQRQL